MRQFLSWAAAVLGTALLAGLVYAAAYVWYSQHALAVSFSSNPNGMASVTYRSFPPSSLLSAVAVAAACTLVAACVGTGVYFLAGRRLGAALFTVAFGPAAVFVFDVVVTVREAAGIPAGQEYLGNHPIALAGRAMVMLIPAAVCVAALLWIGPAVREAPRGSA